MTANSVEFAFKDEKNEPTSVGSCDYLHVQQKLFPVPVIPHPGVHPH